MYTLVLARKKVFCVFILWRDLCFFWCSGGRLLLIFQGNKVRIRRILKWCGGGNLLGLRQIWVSEEEHGVDLVPSLPNLWLCPVHYHWRLVVVRICSIFGNDFIPQSYEVLKIHISLVRLFHKYKFFFLSLSLSLSLSVLRVFIQTAKGRIFI